MHVFGILNWLSQLSPLCTVKQAFAGLHCYLEGCVP